MNSLGIILIHARFQRKTKQNCISFDFDNDLFTFDVISVINTTSSELKHGTPGYFTGKMNLGLIGVCKKKNPSVVFSGERKISTLGEPRFPLERMDPRVEIFLSPLTTHDGFYLSVRAYHFKPTYCSENTVMSTFTEQYNSKLLQMLMDSTSSDFFSFLFWLA